jgi:hypothetical protein
MDVLAVSTALANRTLAFLGFELFGLFVDLGLQPSHAGQRHLFRCHPFLAGHIAAVLADGRQHLMRHPTLELLGLRLPRLHHKTVKTRFADDIRLLPATNRIDDFSSTELILIKHFDGLSWIAKVKDAHTIFEHEPGLPRLVGQGTQCRALEIELLYFVVHVILLRIVLMCSSVMIGEI